VALGEQVAIHVPRIIAKVPERVYTPLIFHPITWIAVALAVESGCKQETTTPRFGLKGEMVH